MAVNITTDTNTVKVTSTSTNNVKIVDNGNNTSVTVSQPTTRVIKVATIGPQGPTGAIPNTGSFATTGSNTFIGAQTITGSNGRLIYRGTTSGVYPTNTLAEIHANDDYPWLERFYNDTFSTSSAIMAYFGWSDGRFVFHNESTQSIGLQVNGFGAENGLLVYSDKVAFVNNVVVTGSLTVSGSSTFTNIGPAVFSGSVGSTQGFTGSLQGTASAALTASFAQGYVLNSNTSSFVLNSQTSSFIISTQTGSLATTGSVTFTGNQIVTGSTRGNVTALSIASNTASMDLSVGNFFTLQLVSGSNTHINPSNILPGQTSILTLSTTGSATVSWPSSVKQPSGSAYVPTTTTGLDILTLASIDSSTIYVVAVKNLI